MYDAVTDPYCYPGTTVLRNKAGIREVGALEAYEAAITAQRADEPLPTGRLTASHYRAVHRHLFQDLYAWAGKYRTVRISKDGSAFCYPENIASQMNSLFGRLKADACLTRLTPNRFAAKAADFLSTLNAIHPFREGNGRTQTTFLALLAHHAGHPLDLTRLEPERFLAAMVASFRNDDRPLEEEIRRLIPR